MVDSVLDAFDVDALEGPADLRTLIAAVREATNAEWFQEFERRPEMVQKIRKDERAKCVRELRQVMRENATRNGTINDQIHDIWEWIEAADLLEGGGE